MKSFGVGMFAYPHAFTIDADGNIYTSDVNDEEAILGVSARDKDGHVLGHEVFKLDSNGKVLMTLAQDGGLRQ